MPSVKQVEGTLPSAFRENCIIDGSEIFMETPSDLHMQSSTWSSYKHHNTAKLDVLLMVVYLYFTTVCRVNIGC